MTEEPQNKAVAQTLDRGLQVLEYVVAGTTRLDDIARATGLSRTVVHRLLTTLTARGYLSPSDGQGWQIGIGLISVASDVIAHIDPEGLVQSEISEIARAVQDTVHFGILDGQDILYLAKAHGRRTVQMVSRVGLRIPAQYTALGKALLSQGDIDAAVANFDPQEPLTPFSVSDATIYRESLLAARRDGFAIDDQEVTVGVRCVAVPLPSGSGQLPAGALSVSVPTAYMTDARIPELVARLKAHAPTVAKLYALEKLSR